MLFEDEEDACARMADRLANLSLPDVPPRAQPRPQGGAVAYHTRGEAVEHTADRPSAHPPPPPPPTLEAHAHAPLLPPPPPAPALLPRAALPAAPSQDLFLPSGYIARQPTIHTYDARDVDVDRSATHEELRLLMARAEAAEETATLASAMAHDMEQLAIAARARAAGAASARRRAAAVARTARDEAGGGAARRPPTTPPTADEIRTTFPDMIEVDFPDMIEVD